MNKIKVLIVDDDSYMHMLFKKIFQEEYFKSRYALNGEVALGMYEKEKPDLIILDMMLPILPGYLVLRRIRRNYGDTDTKIIVSTSLASKSDIVACTRLGIQGYIVKPFDFKEIRKRILKMYSLDEIQVSPSPPPEENLEPLKPVPGEIIKDHIADFMAGELSKKQAAIKILSISKAEKLDLPSMPQIVFKIQEAMERREASAKYLAEILTTDQGLCTKLIGLSNSAYYRGGRECATVEDAIMRVGLDETKELAFVLSNRGLYAMKDARFENDLSELFRHSVACGVVSRLLAEQLREENTYESFTFGILHDIGKLLLVKIFSEIYMEDEGVDLDIIRKLTLKLHNHTGSIFVASMGFPKKTSQIVLHHDNLSLPLLPEETQLAIVMAANLLVRKLGYGEPLADGYDMFDTDACRHVDIKPDILAVAEKRIDTYFNILGAMA